MKLNIQKLQSIKPIRSSQTSTPKIDIQHLTPNKFSRPQILLKDVTKIAIHYVGNPNTSAQNNRNYFNNAPHHNVYVSSHYIVGLKGEIIQCIPENEIAYCTSQANSYSISVETCHPDAGGKFNDKTYKALISLTADLCRRHGLDPIKDVIRHYDVTGKHCPLYYVKNKSAWDKLKQDVSTYMNGGEITPQPIPTSKPIYRVQVGSFSSKQNADNYLKQVQKHYPSAFIKKVEL